MKKIGLVFITFLLAFTLIACTSQPKSNDKNTEGKADIALITDLGTIDDKSFNQGSWEGVVKYAEEFDKSHVYLRPSSGNDDEYYNTIAKAINEVEAKVIVTPGFLFNNAVWRAQKDFPDTHFIFVDSEPVENRDATPIVGSNTVSLLYEEQHAGYLAGYSAVKEGYTKLGFVGGIAVPAVKKFGLGYLYGANDAAEELNVDVEVRWNYAGTFEPSPDVQQLSASWFVDGTEVIFSCGGGLYQSVFKAAEDAGKKAFGVDSDQGDLSDVVLASAVKQLQNSVYDSLKAHFDGTFPGGETMLFGITNDSVGLAGDFSRYENFTQSDYEAIYTDLKNNVNGIRDRIPTDHEEDNPVVNLSRVSVIAQ